MDDDSSLVDHVNHIVLVAKNLLAAGNSISDKMQVSTNLKSSSFMGLNYFIKILNKDLNIDSLPATLALEEERKKWREWSNTMVTEEKEWPTKK